MNNQELEQKVKELFSITNFFDMIEAAMVFKKDYIKTDFYKNTKLPFEDMLKLSKGYYTLQLEGLGSKVQSMINNLDVTSLENVLDQIGDIYVKENAEIIESAKTLRDLTK